MSGRLDFLSTTYKPQLAIVVYTSGNDHYLESHNINESGQLTEGKPLMQETIQGIVDVFFDERQNQIKVGGYLPEKVISFDALAGGAYRMIWFRPAEIRYIHFASPLKIKSGKVWVPAMVYSVDRNELNVFAVKSSSRPQIKTKLFRAPFHNVGDTGRVCLGSARVSKPKTSTYESLMKYWEDLFWLSEFTHLNGASNPTKSAMGNVWKKLVASKTKLKWSGIKELKPYKNYTLKSLIK